ncbi:MAG: gephyrin-like molybdotransferase Glp [Actinomycetes bacterium]
MKPYAAHLADCRRLLPALPTERVPVVDSAGRMLSEDIVTPVDSPAFATSAMDGYAVRVADTPGQLAVAGEVTAGRLPEVAVKAGTAVRIMTGAAIPTGTEAVVPVEDTRERELHVDIVGAVSDGKHIRPAGEDLHAGDVVVRRGTFLGPRHIAALLTVGVTSVPVRRRPRIAIVSTGDELVPPGQVPGPAQLVDSNGPALTVAAIEAGGDVVHTDRVSDEPAELLAALDALPDVDLIVTSGGVSMGRYDVVKAALAPMGITFEPVAMQPGKPQAWGRYRDGAAFLGLPGNPVSALVCFELFGRAVIGCERPVHSAILAADVQRHGRRGLRQFLRGTLTEGGVTVGDRQGSHMTGALARANCLLVVPEDVDQYRAGEIVQVVALD